LEKEKIVLAIELLVEFGFDHRTSKSGIFDHLTIKTIHLWPSRDLHSEFADMEAMWRWSPLVSVTSSLFSPSFFLLSNVGRGGGVQFVGAGAEMAPPPPAGWSREQPAGVVC
jgi:hypothetical protein